MDFLNEVKNHYILTDGAMGTYYGQLYQVPGRMSELANTSKPDQIEKIHAAYIEAGATLIRTNSFASHANTLAGMPLHQCEQREEVLRQIYDNVYLSYMIAKKAVLKSGRRVFIAGDIGPVPESGATQEEEIMAQYKAMADALTDSGAEIILFETFADFRYIFPVISYIRQKASPVIMASFCLNKFGYTKSGLSAAEIIKTANESGVIDVIGFNCGVGSAHMAEIVKNLDLGTMPVSIVPNSGYPDLIRDRNVYQENIGYFCDNMADIAKMGVNMLGGCCGTAPEYIRSLSKVLETCKDNEDKIFDMRRHFAGTKEHGEVDKSRNPFLNKLNKGEKVIAVELDPPHNGHGDKLIQAAALLKNAGADLVTLSDSPMGKMRADAMMTGANLQYRAEVAVMPHVSCRDKNVIAMGSAFLGAHMNGIRNMLVVTGDPVPAGDRNIVTGVYDFNSIRLMNYFKQLNREHFPDDPVIYGGALNYNRTNIDKEIERMQKKCDAGADYFLTQPIYSDEDIERIRYIKTKIHTKILCGIMPLVSYRNAMFMKNEIYGIHVPDEIVARYHKDMSREEGEETGIQIALELAEKLKDVTDGYYFMAPFNRASMICKIMAQLNA